jgi:hypothetical protein
MPSTSSTTKNLIGQKPVIALLKHRVRLPFLPNPTFFKILGIPVFPLFWQKWENFIYTPTFHCYPALVEEKMWEENGKTTTSVDLIKGPITSFHGLDTALATPSKDDTTSKERIIHPDLELLFGKETLAKIETIKLSEWFGGVTIKNLPEGTVNPNLEVPHILVPNPLVEFFKAVNILGVYPIHNPYRKDPSETHYITSIGAIGAQLAKYWLFPETIEVLYREEDALEQWNKVNLDVLKSFNQKAIPYALGTCNSNSFCYTFLQLLFGSQAKSLIPNNIKKQMSQLGSTHLIIPEEEIKALRDKVGLTAQLPIIHSGAETEEVASISNTMRRA